jgi:hypothetical protein
MQPSHLGVAFDPLRLIDIAQGVRVRKRRMSDGNPSAPLPPRAKQSVLLAAVGVATNSFHSRCHFSRLTVGEPRQGGKPLLTGDYWRSEMKRSWP